MPQVIRALRPLLDSRQMVPKEVGDMCYLFTSQIIIPEWKAAPKWATISKLRRMLLLTPDLNKLKGLVRGCPFDDTEILNQAALAYEEFYRRCGGNYETEKARLNTDVYASVPYAKSQQVLKGE
jgi:hypothetical protein